MGPKPTHFVPHLRTDCLGILHLPIELLIVTFSLLHGQDIVRCIRVCRHFADLIRSEIYLQYKIELAQNGMVDWPSSTLPVSERRERLRQYSSNFRNGIFDHETLDAHPDYTRQFRALEWDFSLRTNGATSAIYGVGSHLFLSVFTHGSAKAGIKSCRWLMRIGTHLDRTRWVRTWAIDHAQDLLITVEMVTTAADTRRVSSSSHDWYFPYSWKASLTALVFSSTTFRLLEVRFWSLSGSKTTPTPHPAAAEPCVQVFPPPCSSPTAKIDIFSLTVGPRYVIWGQSTSDDHVLPGKYSIEVVDWRTGQMVSRIEFGTQPVEVLSWDDTYLLVIPVDFDASQRLDIYSIAQSVPSLPLRTLQLPDFNLNHGESVVLHKMNSSFYSSAPEGHFRADPSQCMVVLMHHVRGESGDEYASHLLIPYATLRPQIDAMCNSMDSDSNCNPPLSLASVPWQDWGANGCLRLRVPHSIHHIRLIPSGSRIPIVAYEGPFESVYMIDLNPLAARHSHGQRRADSDLGYTEGKATAVVDDVDAALPGVVDPECSAIPYVVYRFQLPYMPWEHPIRAVRTSMTGFTVTYKGFVKVIRTPIINLFEAGSAKRYTTYGIAAQSGSTTPGNAASTSSTIAVEFEPSPRERACHTANLIRFDVYLQYTIELAKNGMIDGPSGTLPVAERLQRLRQYSSHFRNGIFDHECNTDHSEYLRHLRSLNCRSRTRTAGVTTVLHLDTDSGPRKFYLAVFVDPSTQAGIQSRRLVIPVGNPEDQTRFIDGWIVDHAEDLLVTVESVNTGPSMAQRAEVRLCSWSGSQVNQMDHPAAAVPRLQMSPPPGHSGDPAEHIDLGDKHHDVVLLDDTYILVLPQESHSDSDSEPPLSIYSLAPSLPDQPICSLQLPSLTLRPGEHIVNCDMSTSRRSTPETHFHDDPSVSMVVLTYSLEIGSPPLVPKSRACYLLIPYTALFAQIHMAVDSNSDSDSPLVSPVFVPWQDCISKVAIAWGDPELPCRPG
ncbi:hypothetical protein GSI_02768 [Ganoderma sinense ZZ0214-1]|uniref:F-box domain-containing protein n=1 Tax=Ganoderma sinense ZZ0214-1 TaxID=1077348 RepID=A0A2G8SMJ7_9APHY|nr:hypothetical protein GSI_02768 [Ganoderma sinense ZZ0214-1]